MCCIHLFFILASFSLSSLDFGPGFSFPACPELFSFPAGRNKVGSDKKYILQHIPTKHVPVPFFSIIHDVFTIFTNEAKWYSCGKIISDNSTIK